MFKQYVCFISMCVNIHNEQMTMILQLFGRKEWVAITCNLDLCDKENNT